MPRTKVVYTPLYSSVDESVYGHENSSLVTTTHGLDMKPPAPDADPLYEGQYEDKQPSVFIPRLVQAIASIDSRDPESLPPLYEVVNPDILTNVFTPFSDNTPRDVRCITFPYDSYIVQICANGVFRVYDRQTVNRKLRQTSD